MRRRSGSAGLGALLAFGLGAFAAASDVRQLVLAGRGAHRHGIGAWRGLVGRANGGMVVHIGVVVIAVALAAATSLGHRGEVTLRPGSTTTIEGQTITFERLATVSSPVRTATEALVIVNGHGPYRPAVSQYGANTEPVGTPAIDSNVWHDIYLTIDSLPAPQTVRCPSVSPSSPSSPGCGWAGPSSCSAPCWPPSPAAAVVPPTRCRRPSRPWPTVTAGVLTGPWPTTMLDVESPDAAAVGAVPDPVDRPVKVTFSSTAWTKTRRGRREPRRTGSGRLAMSSGHPGGGRQRVPVLPRAVDESWWRPSSGSPHGPLDRRLRPPRHGRFVALLATRPPAAATEVYTPLLGKPAPTITGTTITGRSFRLAAYRGRWVVLNFFASWCPPCQQEEPNLVTFAYQHRATGDAALIGVVYDDTTANARAFERSAGATWPTVVDPGGQIALRYGVRGPPETFLISPSGQVVAHLDAAVTVADLDQQIAAARAAGL